MVKKFIYQDLLSYLWTPKMHFYFIKLYGDLESIGFKISPYNLCVANCQIKGNQ